VDQDLSELERRARANPEDRDLADRLDRGLLRAGRNEELQQRYRFKFQCPLRFDDLAATPSLSRRTCESCQRSVHLVETPEELAERAAAGDCVAIPRDSLAAGYLELGRSPRLSSAVELEHGCVHETKLRFVDLDRIEIPPAVIDLIPAAFARTYQVLPIAHLAPQRAPSSDPLALDPSSGKAVPLEDPVPCLEIACMPDASSVLAEDLEFMLDIEVRISLADPEAIARALERYYEGSGGYGELMGDVIVAA
jgi:type II secretion system (T2SS) protein E